MAEIVAKLAFLSRRVLVDGKMTGTCPSSHGFDLPQAGLIQSAVRLTIAGFCVKYGACDPPLRSPCLGTLAN
jgi:hypothetical protein